MERLLPQQDTVIATTQAIDASGNWTSDAFDCSYLEQNLLSLMFEMGDAGAGTGRAKIEVLPSIDGVNYPDTLTDVKTGIATADGKTLEKVAMEGIPFLFFKVKVTETSTTENITMSIKASGK